MSDTDDVEKLSTNNTDDVEITDNVPDKESPQQQPEKIVKSYSKRSDKTKAELKKDAKQRAIDNFQRGIPDPEFRVVKLNSGKYRCYPRKEPLQPEPIKLNQIAENKKSEEIITSADSVDKIETKSKSKSKDPFADIVCYNMSNQISEQLNKRLDAVNLELERLRHKNSKLKGKYKQLKQAIYITEEEDNHEDNQQQLRSELQPNEIRPSIQPQPIQQPQHEVGHSPAADFISDIQSQPIQPTKRFNTINFNRFFN